MSWEECIKTNKARKTSQDSALIKALTEMSQRRLEVISSMKLDEKSASIIFVEHYEALREIIEAIANKNRFKVYSHECLTYLLKEILKEELTASKFDRLRKLRNGVNYYGEPVSLEETKKAISEIDYLISQLKQKHLS